MKKAMETYEPNSRIPIPHDCGIKDIRKENDWLIIDFEDDTPPSLEREVMDKIFERLDTGYEWQFCLDRYSLKFAAALAKVPGSCVYDKAKGRH